MIKVLIYSLVKNSWCYVIIPKLRGQVWMTVEGTQSLKVNKEVGIAHIAIDSHLVAMKEAIQG